MRAIKIGNCKIRITPYCYLILSFILLYPRATFLHSYEHPHKPLPIQPHNQRSNPTLSNRKTRRRNSRFIQSKNNRRSKKNPKIRITSHLPFFNLLNLKNPLNPCILRPFFLLTQIHRYQTLFLLTLGLSP